MAKSKGYMEKKTVKSLTKKGHSCKRKTQLPITPTKNPLKPYINSAFAHSGKLACTKLSKQLL